MKQKLKYYSILFFSRPLFFPFFMKLQKFIFWVTNRASAAMLPLSQTGEKIAFEYVFNKIKNNQHLVLFDCGANSGHYSEMMLEILKKNSYDSFELYLFEPSQFFHEELKEKFLKDERIKLIKKAVSDSNGEAKLFYPWVGAGNASLAQIYEDNVLNNNQKVFCETIQKIEMDIFCKESGIHKIDFIKLDIEGFEFKALKGLNQMIKSRKVQVIQFEQGISSLNSRQLLKDFWDEFNSLYNFYLIMQNGLVKLDRYSADLEIFYGASNYIMELNDLYE